MRPKSITVILLVLLTLLINLAAAEHEIHNLAGLFRSR